MSAVSRKAPREEGAEEVKTIPMTVRASATIYEKLRVEADARGISVPALIIYQMGEWLRGDELERKSPAGDPAARRKRRGEEAEEEGGADLVYLCPDCGEQFPIEELVPDGVYLNCPGCEERSSIVTAEEPAEDEEPIVTVRKGKEREEPKVPDVLKCKNDGGLLGDPCGWAGKKSEAAVTFNPLTRERAYSCPKCRKEILKARLFGIKDEVLTCPDCKTPYKREELKESRSWGKDWLVCPGEECGGKVIEAVPAAKLPTAGKKSGKDFSFPWEPAAAQGKPSRKLPESR